MGQAGKPPRYAVVVEDDQDVRHLAAAILEETDLQVVEADSAEEALHFLRQHAPHIALVFADIRLPCLTDGVELARSIHTEWPWIKIILTSGGPDGDDLDKLPDDISYMPKPWRALDVLVEAERAALRA
jgi:CheY-like chemotaxis protein